MAQQMKLAEWIGHLHLDRIIEPLLTQTAEYGFESLDDLKQIVPDEVKALSDAVRMNNIEYKRFSRAIEALQQGQLGQVKGMSGGAGQQAEPDPQEQMLKRQQEELAKQKMELDRQRAELNQQMLEVRNLQSQNGQMLEPQKKRFEWFQVLKSLVHIKNTPHKDAKTVATAERNHRLQVSLYREEDDEKGIWVELTEWEMRRCKLAPPLRGFALIDGTHLGLGPILKGPCDPAELPEVTAKEPNDDDDEELEEQQAPAAPFDWDAVIAANWEAEMTRLKKIWAMDPPRKRPSHLIMSVDYTSARGTVCLFRASVSKETTVLMFRAGFCSDTGLSAKSTMLAMTAGRSTTAPHLESMPVGVLDTAKTLEDCGFKENGTVALVYIGNFEEDYQQGFLLRE